MSTEARWAYNEEPSNGSLVDKRSGFCALTGIYHSLLRLGGHNQIPTQPDLDTATFVLSQFPHPDHAEFRVALIDSATHGRVTYALLQRSVNSLAAGLYYAVGVRKGDVVFLVSPNSLLYPIISLAVLSLGAILSAGNPLNTAPELAKQVHDSGARLVISTPDELHKMLPTGVPIIVTTRTSDRNSVSIEELIEGCNAVKVPKAKISQSDAAVILYSSGTTGVSKGVVLTHANIISCITLLKWTIDVSSAHDDVFLCFVPMFHIYGLIFFALGLFCIGNTTVLMPKFEFKAMLEAIQTHRVSNIPAVPPVLLAMVKNPSNSDLSSLRRVGSGAAPLSREVAKAFREKFPWVQLRPGYGLTETTGSGGYFVSDEQAKAHPESSGQLFPTFSAKVVDVRTGLSLPPGDLCYIDEDGFLYIVDRIKELIKHNGYQVAPAELEAILLSHPHILDAAVIPVEDEETGQIPMAYVVRVANSGLTEEQVIQFVASQVAPYKKVRNVAFINAIPRSAAGKILRKDLVAQTKRQPQSKL